LTVQPHYISKIEENLLTKPDKLKHYCYEMLVPGQASQKI
jgi:hypothetical protein